MSRGELRRHRFLKRASRPYALSTAIATGALTLALVLNSVVGNLLNTFPGDILAVMAAVTTALLASGWWFRKDSWMVHGLLWSAGVWGGAAVILTLEGISWLSATLAWCFVIGSGGAWLLEVEDRRVNHVQ